MKDREEYIHRNMKTKQDRKSVHGFFIRKLPPLSGYAKYGIAFRYAHRIAEEFNMKTEYE